MIDTTMFSYIEKLSQIRIKLALYYLPPCYVMTAKTNIRLYLVFINPQNFDAVDMFYGTKLYICPFKIYLEGISGTLAVNEKTVLEAL